MTEPSSTRAAARAAAIWKNDRFGPLLLAVLGSALIFYGLARPNGLFGVVQYDDGVYFDAAVRLVSGSIPYRDFVMVQPPAVAVVFAPLALLARHIGTSDGLAIARCVTALVCGANVYLTGRLLHERGRVAATASSAIVALFPAAVFADRTLLLEPYVVLFVLLGARRCFEGGRIASRRNLFVAGLWLGAAISTKIWAAVLLFAVVAAVLSPRSDRAQRLCVRARDAATLSGGTVFAATIICVPFFVAAPSAFFHDVVSAQISRHTGALTPIWLRLSDIVGIDGTGAAATEILAYVVAGVLGLIVLIGGAVPMLRREVDTVGAFLLITTGAATVAILVPSQYYNHYSYFVAPFLAGAVVVSISSLAKKVRGRATFSPRTTGAMLIALGCVFFAAAATLGIAEARFDNTLLLSTGDPSLAIDLAVPQGACAISDATILLIEANRAIPVSSECPALVDATGLWLAIAPREPPLGCEMIAPTLVSDWQSLLSRSDFFVESGSAASRVPWTIGLRAWFKHDFRHIPDPGVQVFVRAASPYAATELNPARWTMKRLLAEGWRPAKHHGAAHPVQLPACLAVRR